MTPRRRSLPVVLQIWTVGTLVLSLLCTGAERIASRIPRFDHLPYNRMTLEASGDYVDFWMFNTRITHFHTLSFFDEQWGSHFLYPAPLTLFYAAVNAVMGRLPHHTTFFLLLILSIFAALAILLGIAIKRRGISMPTTIVFILLATLTSYPFSFELNRANMEIFVWLIAGVGVLAFIKDRPWVAATCIGVAGACKLFPYIYVGLLIIRKRYWQAAWTFVVGGLTTLFSLWAVTGNMRYTATRVAQGLEEFRQLYVLKIRWQELGLDHSIFGLIKRLLPNTPSPHTMLILLDVYLPTAAVAATCLFFFRVRKMPVINQVTFLTVACIVLPPVSYDYTLLHVYTPWALFVLLAIDRWRSRQPTPPGLLPAFLCLVLLLSPQNEVIFHGERLEGAIKCLALLALAGISLIYPFEEGRIAASSSERSSQRASEMPFGALSSSAS